MCPCVCGALGETNTLNLGAVQTHLLICKESQNLGEQGIERLGNHPTPAEARQTLGQLRCEQPDCTGTAPVCWGAYLGRGNDEEPAGRWRGEACCRRAPRGWGCSGHFHCLQTEEHRQWVEEGEGSKAKHFKLESLFRGSLVSPACGAAQTLCPGEGVWSPQHVHTEPDDLLIQPRFHPFNGPLSKAQWLLRLRVSWFLVHRKAGLAWQSPSLLGAHRGCPGGCSAVAAV